MATNQSSIIMHTWAGGAAAEVVTVEAPLEAPFAKDTATNPEASRIKARIEKGVSAGGATGGGASPRGDIFEAGTVHGVPVRIPMHGGWRSNFCDCCNCPMCCVAWCFPYIIWAQLHYHLNGGQEPADTSGCNGCCYKGMRGCE